ncbi:MAG: hypothetical protein ACP5SH_02190 [Syntrophobacteraceae bacterium]
MKSRDLMDLGPDIFAHINYAGTHGFWLNPDIEETLQEMGVKFVSEDLEEVFKPFLRPDIRKILDQFDPVRRPVGQIGFTIDELAPGHRKVHLFDARRLYFLRLGRIDRGELGAKHWKFLNALLLKSRDEIEVYIERMEHQLRPDEYAPYVYACLGIALLLPAALRAYPGGVSPEKMDRFVIEELCRIDDDEDFFLGVCRQNGGSLHPYLIKYAWLYFDFPFQAQSRSERFHFEREYSRPPVSRPSMSVQAACKVFGITEEQLRHIGRDEITRLFRRKAKDIHPDRGGDHESFLALSKAYGLLLSMKQ